MAGINSAPPRLHSCCAGRKSAPTAHNMLTIAHIFHACHHKHILTQHGDFLRLLFLQAHREIAAHFTAIGMPAQQHCDSFRFRRAQRGCAPCRFGTAP